MVFCTHIELLERQWELSFTWSLGFYVVVCDSPLLLYFVIYASFGKREWNGMEKNEKK